MGKPLDPVCYRTPREERKTKKMAATSINIQPIKSGSEAHNFRLKELDYVNKELTHLNESISQDNIPNRLEKIKIRYTETTGQQMQKKATPIREGVIVIQNETKMEQLKNFAQDCEKKFGINAFQIHIHRDEGHRDILTQEWKPNLHAHIVFDWTDISTGKSCKLNRQDLAEMQTMCANSLGMERGVSSDKVHLNAMQFKAIETEKSILQISALVETKESALELIKIESEEIQSKHAISKTVSKTAEKINDLLGMTKNDREKEELKIHVETLSRQVDTFKKKNDFNEHRIEVLIRERNEARAWQNSLQKSMNSVKQKLEKIAEELGMLANILPKTWQEWIQNHLPSVAQIVLDGNRKLDQEQKNIQGFDL